MSHPEEENDDNDDGNEEKENILTSIRGKAKVFSKHQEDFPVINIVNASINCFDH